MRFLFILIILLSQGAFAQAEFNEGTQTQLTAQDIKDYIPWAQNAKKELKDALDTLKAIPLKDKVKFLEEEIKKVVISSANKKYQMIMRYALNRGLLLSNIIEKEAGTNVSIQNQLSILTQSILVSFEFYESDLDFQKRASRAQKNETLVIAFGELGIKLAKVYLHTAKEIFDVSAQYHVMRKTLELLRKDLHQDQDVKTYAGDIVDITKALERLPEVIQSDEEALKGVRAMNYLINKIGYVKTSKKELEKEKQSWFPKKNVLYYVPQDRHYFYMGNENIKNAFIICDKNPLLNKRWHLITFQEAQEMEEVLKDPIVGKKFFNLIDQNGPLWTSDRGWPSNSGIITPSIRSEMNMFFNSVTESSLYFKFKVICVADE